MAGKKVNSTRLEIIRVALHMFLERGYTNTTLRAICDELGISTGNLTFYFPSKEHLLAVLVEMLCDFQEQLMDQMADEGKSSLLSLCLEMTSIAAACDQDETVKDFYLAAYTHPLTIEIIRKSDKEKTKRVFREYCTDWSDEQFVEAELLRSGIEYTTLMTTPDSPPLDVRIAGAINGIMLLYGVPADVRKVKREKVLKIDYRLLGRRILKEFKQYIDDVNEHAFEESIARKAHK